MVGIILALLGWCIYGDLKVAIYIGLGFWLAKSLLRNKKD